jgi:hypothetical protein
LHNNVVSGGRLPPTYWWVNVEFVAASITLRGHDSTATLGSWHGCGLLYRERRLGPGIAGNRPHDVRWRSQRGSDAFERSPNANERSSAGSAHSSTVGGGSRAERAAG